MRLIGLFIAFSFIIVNAGADTLPHGLGHPKAGQAHWYDKGCCDMRDCEALPDEAVHQTATGYHVRYIASSGYRVDQVVPFDQVRPLRDHQWHGCASQIRFLCLYGQMGV